MGYFSDLDYRIRAAGGRPETWAARAPRCIRCGKRMQIVGLGHYGSAVQYECPGCPGRPQ